jgi:excisionase family DNA binding protein
MLMATDLKDMLTVSQAARRLEVSSQLVRRWLADGRLPAVETPLGRLLPREVVDQLAEARCRARQTREARG